ncbi:RxLR effector protein [Phytophthora megakarya]|uniref:RxLR effector protein n=1 Tax=Phytophthora megakarya TaxID=4795 RepID=A0A225V1C3_9STRA|nr:RxLR effector protein [Phytophthora megakarya]
MRFTYLLFIAATVLLVNPDVVCAHKSIQASVETATQPNSIDVETTKRSLRSHKWTDGDTNADNEERGRFTNEFLNHWLSKGHSPGQAGVLIKKFTITTAKQERLIKKYGEMYRKTYGTFK